MVKMSEEEIMKCIIAIPVDYSIRSHIYYLSMHNVPSSAQYFLMNDVWTRDPSSAQYFPMNHVVPILDRTRQLDGSFEYISLTKDEMEIMLVMNI